MKNKVFIQVGKFQTPNTAFHKGHLAVSQAIIDEMIAGDLLYISVAERQKNITFDKTTTENIIREIVRPFEYENILIGHVDHNYLFGLYNVPKPLQELNGEQFLEVYEKRIDEFIEELNKGAIVDFNDYYIVLVTGKEEKRAMLYRKGDEKYNLNRDFNKDSTERTQYMIVDILEDGDGKVSSSKLRKTGKIMTCRDLWGNSESLCDDIDNEINKILNETVTESCKTLKDIIKYK